MKIPGILDDKLSEDIGIHIGDGCITRNNTGYEITYSMNAVEDLEYSKFVLNLKKILFNIDFKTRIIKENEIRFNTYSKTLARFYNEIFNIPLGPKTNIKIPEIIENTPVLLKSCLRGIIDTDFSLAFKNRGKRKNFYPVLMASFGNKIIMESVKRAFDSLGFKTSSFVAKKYDKRYNKSSFGYQITLNGKDNIELWWKLIGSHNPRLMTRYSTWKKFGHVSPHLSIKERIEMLK
ncbi:MAG: hypothetical protein NT120_01330 [Candidatus Aenigmarchaeota archaeon]|nr:hypothetical protein [Candidatus Aenigmarchaeota archaeon]